MFYFRWGSWLTMWSWLQLNRESLWRSLGSLSLSRRRPFSGSCELNQSPVLSLRITALRSPTGVWWLFEKTHWRSPPIFKYTFCVLYSGSMRACTTMQSTSKFPTHQTWHKRNGLTFWQTPQRYLCWSLLLTICWLKQLANRTPFIMSLKYIFLVVPSFDNVSEVCLTSWKIASIFVYVSFSLSQRWPQWWLGLCTCRLEEQKASWTTLMLTLKQYDFQSYFVNLKCLTLQDAVFLFDNWSVNHHEVYSKCIFIFVYIVYINII